VEPAQSRMPLTTSRPKASIGASHQYSSILVLLNNYTTTLLCIKFIGIG
jgi:hypothetical protein